MLFKLRDTLIEKILIARMYITRKVDINISPERIQAFCNNCDNWVLFLDEDLSSETIKNLYNRHINSEHCSDLILSEIAEHGSTPVDILESLSKSQSERVLIALATNPRISKQIIDRLKKTEISTVIEHLNLNKSVPKE